MSKIFISYRRDDSRLVTNRIYDRVKDAFGKKNIFKDVDNIPSGRDFRGVLREATAQCQVMLVIIGPDWVDIRDKTGNRRLDNPNDFVRLEVETGLQRDGTLVIPVLVEGADMPSATMLPDSLKELAYNNAFRVDDDPRFHRDMDTLIADARAYLGGIRAPKIDWRWVIGVILVPVIVALIGFASQNPNLFGIGGSDAQPSATTEVAQAASNTPNAVQTNTPSPLEIAGMTQTQEMADFQATLAEGSRLQATREILTATAFAPTREAQQQATVNTILTATRAAVLLLTPSATPLPPSATPSNTPTLTRTPTDTPPPTNTATPDMLDPERLALEGVSSNAEWRQVAGAGGYVREFDGVEMVLVPAGTFMMGSDSQSDEQPVHEQQITAPFWIDKYEVTNELYGSTGCTTYSSDPDQPRNCISWFDANEFCLARSARLPTEAEWEYATRGVDSLIYPWGNDYDAAFVIGYDDPIYGGNSTAPVGSRPDGASWVGALDMSGNVWEWTSSLYEDYPYVTGDGREADTGNRTDVRRVLRGGSFDYSSFNLRSAFRFRIDPIVENFDLGFRCVRS